MATVPQHIQCLPTPMRERTSQRLGETNGSLPLTTICSSILTHRCELAHLDWASLSSNYNTKRRETNTTNPITEDLFLEQSPTIVIILRFFHARYRTILSLASNSSSTQTTRQHKTPPLSLSSHFFPSSPGLATYTHYHKFSTKAPRTFNLKTSSSATTTKTTFFSKWLPLLSTLPATTASRSITLALCRVSRSTTAALSKASRSTTAARSRIVWSATKRLRLATPHSPACNYNCNCNDTAMPGLSPSSPTAFLNPAGGNRPLASRLWSSHLAAPRRRSRRPEMQLVVVGDN